MAKVKKQDEKQSKPHLHAGHRQRMFEKLSRGELCEHELLETLLFFAIPRRNTNEIAHRLLYAFGSIDKVLSADAEALEQVEGMGKNSVAFLQCFAKICQSYGGQKQACRPRLFERDSFLAFLKGEYKRVDEEALDVYLLNADGEIFLRKRYYSYLTDDDVSFPTKWLQTILIRYDPSGILLVHNHPSDEAEPSKADDIATEKCQMLCQSMDVLLGDHYICAGQGGVYSYYTSGKLLEIIQSCIKRDLYDSTFSSAEASDE